MLTTAEAWFKELIVKVTLVGADKTWNFLSSNWASVKPVPLGRVTESKTIISPTSKSWAVAVVMVHVLAVVLLVAKVEPAKITCAPALFDLQGVIS